ncbi:hypothetical protein GCM10020220_054590 [Nonomuraea rubra]
MTDSVKRAAETPDEPMPFAELGMKEDEYDRAKQMVLGRAVRPAPSWPSTASLWSEHCSYKSSKVPP